MLKVPTLAAHMFVFYFGIIADITPPVALAAYAGAGIAKSDPFMTGVIASKLAIGAFIIPYIFVYNPAMLLIGTTVANLTQNLITASCGMFGVGAAMIGYCLAPMRWWERDLVRCRGSHADRPWNRHGSYRDCDVGCGARLSVAQQSVKKDPGSLLIQENQHDVLPFFHRPEAGGVPSVIHLFHPDGTLFGSTNSTRLNLLDIFTPPS